MNSPTPFQQLLQAAHAQAEPQRLLFVFAAAELPDDASPAQRADFLAGRGGTLTPQACVDKAPAELSSFEALCRESEATGLPWQVVFIAALAGRDRQAPTPAQVDQALQRLVERVRQGGFSGLLALDRQGQSLSFAG